MQANPTATKHADMLTGGSVTYNVHLHTISGRTAAVLRCVSERAADEIIRAVNDGTVGLFMTGR